MLLHLEIGNAVAQQPADPIFLLEDDDLVPRARELLRASETGRSRPDDRNAFARFLARRTRNDPAFLPPFVDDEVLDRLDSDRIVVDVERARGLARRRTDPAGELGKLLVE
jgi:hypothetical protein